MKTQITTKNPYTNKVLKTYDYFTDEDISKALNLANKTFQSWKTESLSNKTTLLKNVAENLSLNKEKYCRLITMEMGKPITESFAEIDKCIYLCDFYIENAARLLSDEIIETNAQESFISYDPLGCILGIMPWNFPFWQVLRFAVPTLTAGNTVILKHASNVTGCALAIQEIFESSGYPKGCFTTLLTGHDTIETIIKNDIIKAISLTGSEKSGRKIAEIAGAQLKKLVLELGGNNACVILNDAHLEKHIDTIVKARMQNTGQSCIAAKRFIVEVGIYDEFLEKFTKKIEALTFGDPILDDTEIGTLAREDLADILEDQVNKSMEKGAHVHYGNKRDKTYYQPTILTGVTKDMPVFTEETFGPVAAIIKASTKEEAYKMVNDTKFGLGTMIFTEDTKDAKQRIIDIEDGAFFINEMVKSDPRLPFGGTKHSGYGRELSKEGILAFTNKKTVYIK
ncbi:NAD-dependent succinate-semialdehyde dehydrogenase [Flavivirga sp. 57AJ16]|uniref:NAD-dependent succinate-semialdehyde dehydrogenase n=1 Tax=Flavivirga sp. 57AJ16 TaxID=3025307 RepID=UPI0023651F36|nr:NAD-dependent succinate-semialdehyde dehydrogenase [Flavivirga sp. 57AJ16]MDD7887724.1 NAD-dependent succinate-semialdehyde dehydrogenase [Flavivirga sp. 57AJ16]